VKCKVYSASGENLRRPGVEMMSVAVEGGGGVGGL